MFQDFTDRTDPSLSAPRVSHLREELLQRGLDGWLVSYADNHQSEYLPENAKRLFWLSGFSGSAGFAIVLMNDAALFVDGRYTLQAEMQVDGTVFTFHHLIEEPPHAYLAKNASKNANIGYDPWLHTETELKRFEKACKEAGANLLPITDNVLDHIWSNRPPAPASPLEVHPLELAGREAADKIAEAQATIKKNGADAAVLTMSESPAWLLNIRGRDVPQKPLILANLILPANGKPVLFIEENRIDAGIRDELDALVEIAPRTSFETRLEELGKAKKTVQVDRATAPAAVSAIMRDAGAEVINAEDPCVLPRAIKNETEIDGARAAQKRDGSAFCRFLAWLDRTAGSGTIDEIAAAKKAEEFRRETGKLVDISFDTISGAGPNGAIVHYRVSETTSRLLEPGNLYLCDSGGQYRDGTTDITRTVAIGTPTDDMRHHYTLVLKGHIAISTVRFPRGTTGTQLDVLARLAMWREGFDYDHGTGHGVGSFLGVHEGPQRIAKSGSVALEPGMLLTNEPGYYKAGAYGIRIENLILVEEEKAIEGGEKPMRSFETLSLAPYDRRLIDTSLLLAEEIAWVDTYHARVRKEVAPALDAQERAWLEAATAPL